jgi:hypothetical protein
MNEDTRNLPGDCIKTSQTGIKALQRLIKIQIEQISETKKALEALDADLDKQIALLEAVHDKIDPINRHDNRPGVSADPATVGFPYKGVNVDRVFNP